MRADGAPRFVAPPTGQSLPRPCAVSGAQPWPVDPRADKNWQGPDGCSRYRAPCATGLDIALLLDQVDRCLRNIGRRSARRGPEATVRALADEPLLPLPVSRCAPRMG